MITTTTKTIPLEQRVREKLKLVLDPELGVSIVDLGLIYNIVLADTHRCIITMTLTTIGCPLFAQIQKEIEARVMELPEIEDVKIELTFDPPWTVDKMSPEAKIQLGLDE
ncbi:MAG TPA: metal-sulfur cluster assembly factor [Patescibacteria group bacterium]|nr:metal-sulfur cluster assembly factor [Patescibacteria group bacterium]